MEYRKLPGGSEKISILGLGNSSLGQAGEKEAQAAGIRYIFRFFRRGLSHRNLWLDPEPGED